MFISVIIPTRNRCDLLGDTLACLRAQNYPPDQFEVIVVSDGSTDQTEQVTKRFDDGRQPLVRYVSQPPTGLNAARNNGLQHARGDLIVYTDDDVEMPAGWLTAYADVACARPEAAAFGGPVHPKIEAESRPHICGGCGTLEELEEFNRGADTVEVPWVIGANMAARRDAFEKVGTFDETLRGGFGDETEWHIRCRTAGLKILYVPEARLLHRRMSRDMQMLLKRKYRKSKGGVWYRRQTGGIMPNPFDELKEIVRYSLHTVRRRCFIGKVRLAVHLGLLVGWFLWTFQRGPGKSQ